MKGCVQRNPVCAKEMSAIRTCVKNESVDYEQKRRIKNLGEVDVFLICCKEKMRRCFLFFLRQ